MIKIRQAVYEDIPRIMRFIDEHWKKGHIMGNDRTMFEFQHVRGREVFYILAEDDVDGRIYGSMGYIPMAEQEYPCMSTVMIQSLDNPEKRMLGEEMARYFERNMHCRNIVSVGVEKRYAKVIDALGANLIGKLHHYYRLGTKRDFQIARIYHYNLLPVTDHGNKLVPLKSFREFADLVDLNEIKKDYPERSPAYIEHRYYQHPYYTYKIWGIHGRHGIKSAFAAREEMVGMSKVLRIVDFFGKDTEFACIGSEINRILLDEDYEYIDFYCYGIDHNIMQQAGFLLKGPEDPNIIPNYFDPFEQKNVDIYFYAWRKEKVHVYRGFGDQDRPNHPGNKGGKK